MCSKKANCVECGKLYRTKGMKPGKDGLVCRVCYNKQFTMLGGINHKDYDDD